jgi:hypothetical protein
VCFHSLSPLLFGSDTHIPIAAVAQRDALIAWKERTDASGITEPVVEPDPTFRFAAWDSRLRELKVGSGASDPVQQGEAEPGRRSVSIERELCKETSEASEQEEDEKKRVFFRDEMAFTPLTMVGEPVLVVGPVATKSNLALLELVYARK